MYNHVWKLWARNQIKVMKLLQSWNRHFSCNRLAHRKAPVSCHQCFSRYNCCVSSQWDKVFQKIICDEVYTRIISLYSLISYHVTQRLKYNVKRLSSENWCSFHLHIIHHPVYHFKCTFFTYVHRRPSTFVHIYYCTSSAQVPALLSVGYFNCKAAKFRASFLQQRLADQIYRNELKKGESL